MRSSEKLIEQDLGRQQIFCSRKQRNALFPSPTCQKEFVTGTK